jgi:hypothetical protein
VGRAGRPSQATPHTAPSKKEKEETKRQNRDTQLSLFLSFFLFLILKKAKLGSSFSEWSVFGAPRLSPPLCF